MTERQSTRLPSGIEGEDMTHERKGNESAAGREEALWQRDVPPSEIGDVEDAVAEEVGGDLTEWAPPDDEGASEMTVPGDAGAKRS
jgi:hypothetical protein